MDIAKYIGQFLLKNNFCYIHGLGNLELIKRAGKHDGKALQPATYEIHLTSGGSIDDSFANFIATAEQISISKAANSLRDFSMQSRKDIAEGKEVIVPNIGKFYQENDKVKFITDANFRFSPAGIPTVQNSKQLEEQKIMPPQIPLYPSAPKKSNVNWSMIMVVVILLVVLAGAGYVIYYFKTQQEAPVTLPTPASQHKDTVAPATPPPVAPAVDTLKLQHEKDSIAAAMAVVDNRTVNKYQLIIGEYANKAAADKRYRGLKISGQHVAIVTKDSVNFKVLIDLNCKAADTTKMKDSLGKFYGYSKPMIYSGK